MTPPEDPRHEPPPRRILRPSPSEPPSRDPVSRPPRRVPRPAPDAAEDTLFAAPKYSPPPPREAPRPGPQDAAREELIEEIIIEEEGRGFGYIFSAVFMTIGIVLGGIYGLKQVVERGYLDQYKFLYQEVSLMPAKTLQPPSAEGSIQLFLPDDGLMLTTSLQRLRRSMKPAEKDRVLLEAFFAPETQAAAARIIPAGAAPRGYYTVGRTGYLDMNEAFTKAGAPSPRAERLAVYSIINSLLLNNPDLDAIQILVEGRPVETAWGWLDLSAPLGPDLSLIR